MAFDVLLHPKASEFLEKATHQIESRIRKKLDILRSEPERGERLRHSVFRRLRIGDYRAIYEIDRSKRVVIVLFIGHRREVYDDFSRLL